MRRHADLISIAAVVLLFSLCTCLYAQRSLMRTYTVGNGLVMNRVRGFHQDKEGFIWMYTWDGLSRYEGYRFRNYIAGRDLQHSFVNAILESDDGGLSISLNDGSMAVMKNQQVQAPVQRPGDIINDFYRDEKGIVYVGTDFSGICLFVNGKLVPLDTSQPVKSIQQVIHFNDHFFFIGPYSGPSGVYDANFTLVGSWHKPPAFFNDIYKDHRDRIYVCTIEGLKEVDLDSPVFELKEIPDIPHDVPWKKWNVSSIVVTPEDDWWIGTSQGLIHFRPDRSWTVFTVQDGLLSNQIHALFIDKSNTLWIGTDAGAASINLQTEIIDNRNLPGVFANYLSPGEDGSIYVISGNTVLSRLDKNIRLINSVNISHPDNLPQGLITRQGGALVVRQSSVEELNNKNFPFQLTGNGTMGTYYVEAGERYWVITGHGFYCTSFPGNSNFVSDTSYNATAIAPARDEQMLIGTLQNGIFLAKPLDDPIPCMLQKVKDFSPWTDDLGVRSLMTSRNGDIWIGTRFSGVVRLQCDDDYEHCTKQTYSITNGLVSNWITSIAEDKSGNIWVGSASGIDKLIPRQEKYFVFSFSRVNGYYAHVRHLAVHPDGSLWVGHGEGLSRIVDGRIDTIAPSVTHITEVTLGGKEYPSAHASPANLRYYENSAHFAFAAPDFINSSQLMFSYRLLGSNDTAWSPPVKTNEIFYGNLKPGNFRFEVAAYGWNGDRSVPASYAFEILNPFWKQTWFIVLSIILLMVATFAVYHFRIAQLNHVQKVRDRIAADLHDEIGSSLTHINILSEIGKQHRTDGNGASNLFERIGEEVQSSSEALDDIIWSVKTKRDAIGDIIARMRQYATEIFEPVDIAFYLTEHVEGIESFHMEFKRDFYLVYKEILRNILRHAEASRVDIMVNVDRSKVILRITDDGIGFDKNAPSDRSGLSNIQARVKKWGGKVEWNSFEGKGTQVFVEMKPA